jgi:hypothetical protein
MRLIDREFEILRSFIMFQGLCPVALSRFSSESAAAEMCNRHLELDLRF